MGKKDIIFGILYLERDRFIYFSPSHEQPLILQLDRDTLSDLEVVSKSNLERQLQSWFETQKITPMETLLILSDQVYFSQDFTGNPLTEDNAQITGFTQLVPFNQKHIALLPTGQNTRVVVINEQLLFPIIETLKKLNFQVLAALPAYLIQADIAAAKVSDLLQLVTQNLAILLPHNFLKDIRAFQPPDNKKEFYSFKFDKKVISLILIFTVLVSILVILLMNQQ